MALELRFTVILVSFVLLLQIALSTQTITSVESHLVAVCGTKVILRCVDSFTDRHVFWIYKNPREQRVYVVSEGMANSAGHAQHVIERVNLNHSGNYKCQDQNAHDSMELVVVSDNSSCRLEPDSREVAEQDSAATFTCRLSYSGNSDPFLRWTNSHNISKDGATVRRSEAVNTFPEIESRIRVTNGGFNQTPYVASVCLNHTATKCLPFWRSPSLRGFVPVANVTVAMVTVNNTDGGRRRALNCSAVGYPTPSYTWVDPTGGKTQGSIATLSDSFPGLHTYKCIAWNTFRNRNYTVESEVNIRTAERTSTFYTNEPTTAVVIATSSAAAAAAAAATAEVFAIDGIMVRIFGAGLLVLVAIVAFACVFIAAILCTRRRRHRRRQMEPGACRPHDSNSNSEPIRRITVDDVSRNETLLHIISMATESDRGLEKNATSEVYDEIHDYDDNEYEKCSRFMGTETTSGEKERNEYSPLDSSSRGRGCRWRTPSIEGEGEIEMPSEYMTTVSAAELKNVCSRQTLTYEPIIEGRHYLKVLP